jgi:hypothetical protein
LVGLILAAFALRPPAEFREHTVADGLKGGYQVVAADLNGDGRPDIACIGSATANLKWYENVGATK